MRKDQLDGSERHLRQALEAAPTRRDAQLFLAQCLLNKKTWMAPNSFLRRSPSAPLMKTTQR